MAPDILNWNVIEEVECVNDAESFVTGALNRSQM